MKPTTFLTTAEVAASLDVSGRTVLRLVESGRLTPATKAPGRNGALLFDADEIDRYTDTLEAQPSAS